MDLKIRLTPEAEMDLAREARRQGLPPEEAAARLLQERLTQGRREAARSLLREWQQEASAPAETGQTQAEWEALKSALDEDRLSHRKLFAEEAMTVILDTGILGLLTQHRGILQAEECRSWLDNLLANGAEVLVPEIADYELRRELLRLGQTTGLQRLDQLESVLEYLPVTTQAMRQAAAFWAEARKKGRPTSDAHALDGDCILAAQALTLGEPSVVIATTNVGHLSLFVQAQEWWEIR